MVRDIRRRLQKIRNFRSQLQKMEKGSTTKELEKNDLEADIRFEEKYYDHVAQREKEILEYLGD